jgi:hypothetical protein
MASFSASRTVISFWPEAYPLRAIDGVMAAARNAGRKAGRDAASRRAAGRVILEAAIVCDALGVLESEGGGRAVPDGNGRCGEAWDVMREVFTNVQQNSRR